MEAVPQLYCTTTSELKGVTGNNLVMKYCSETVLVQSAFMLANRTANLNQINKRSVAPLVKIIGESIQEVSTGLTTYGDRRDLLLCTEIHYKLHAWIYNAWRRKFLTDEGSYFSEFPPLPSFGTVLYVELLSAMEWRDLLVECLLYSTTSDAVIQIQDIITTLTHDPDASDVDLFVLLFESFLNPRPGSDTMPDGTSNAIAKVLLSGLISVHQFILNKSTQFSIVKKLIEFSTRCSVGSNDVGREYILGKNGGLTHCNKPKKTIDIPYYDGKGSSVFVENIPSATRLEKLDIKELKKLHHKLENHLVMEHVYRESSNYESDNYLEQHQIHRNNGNMTQMNTVPPAPDAILITSEGIQFIEFLCSLLTKQWNKTFNWSTSCHDNGSFGQMDSSLWHPLHQWIVRLYTLLGFVVTNTTSKGLSSEMISLTHNGLVGYVEAFATTVDHEMILSTHNGSVHWQFEEEKLEEEFVDIPGLNKSLLFKFSSSEDQFVNALWRITHRLDGYDSCLDWLLTAEDYFNEPKWLECIKDNVLEIGGKHQAVMMVDILCVQWQVIDSCQDHESSTCIFEEIRDVFIELYNSLPTTDKEELTEYTYAMSATLAGDTTCDSVLFHPQNIQEDKSRLQQDLRLAFNRLVDSREEAAFDRAMKGIHQLALVSPFMTLSSAVQAGIQYGQTHTIYKVLQRLPNLCQMSSCDTDPPILCDVLRSWAGELKSQQEESNLMSLIGLLLQPFMPDGLPILHQPLLSITDLVRTCVLPYLYQHDSQEGIPTPISLQLLKSSLKAVSVNQSTNQSFVLRYLIPIILCLCKLLGGCKVLWDGMVPDLSPVEVVKLRSLVLDVLDVAVRAVLSLHQGGMAGMKGPVEWLCSKISQLDWTLSLYMEPLVEVLHVEYTHRIPSCLTEVCDLPVERWMAISLPDYGVITALFDCCRVSDSITNKMSKALQSEKLLLVACDVEGSVVNNLIKVLSYCTWPEVRRIISFCKELVRDGILHVKDLSPNKEVLHPSFTEVSLSQNPLPSLSHVLLKVVQKLTSPCCSLWTTPLVFGHVIKHYVRAIKELCTESVLSRQPDQTVDDIITLAAVDVCHVMCRVPDDVTHPIFVLALDLVSMVTGDQVTKVLRQCVARLPQQVYRDSLLQKLGAP